jgi:hypothetical protein
MHAASTSRRVSSTFVVGTPCDSKVGPCPVVFPVPPSHVTPLQACPCAPAPSFLASGVPDRCSFSSPWSSTSVPQPSLTARPAHPAHTIGEPAQQAPTVWPWQLLLRCEACYRPASSARSLAEPGRCRQNLPHAR